MISEKDKKIVAAVFASRGKPKGDNLDGHVISKCTKTNGFYNKGDVLFANKGASNSYYEYICTIEEYNQCIEDMSRDEWMNSGVDKSYMLHVKHCKNNGVDTSNKELLEEHCDYSFYDKPVEELILDMKAPLVYTQGDCVELYVEEHASCNLTAT